MPKKRIISLILFVLFLSVYIYINLNYKYYPEEEKLKRINRRKMENELVNKYPSRISAKDKEGNEINLLENIGKKVIIINFFGTWCEPCKLEMPELNRFYKSADKGFIQLVGVCVSQENNNDKVSIETFIKENNIKFPIYEYVAGFEQFNSQSIPITVMIGVDGKFKLIKKGVIANSNVAFEKLINKNRELVKKNMDIDFDTYMELKGNSNGK